MMDQGVSVWRDSSEAYLLLFVKLYRDKFI